jgi:hypothetical protein
LDLYRYPVIKGKMCRLLPYSTKFATASLKDKQHEDGTLDLFVKGFIKLNWTHQDLYNEFSQFGKVVSAKISVDKEHKSRGYGYV